ncbi:DNA replication/repair protein RecF [Domibacillus mangrovi]|uniref:DNA replication and repair protein RecF n=1 Tax=Domibacillus mangrovi TaxID=1714354 RepID=A0A1Q5P597_9BACI|nr:DNA replication/repair protein RecF [Domibacillus mangrovi]OKL37404.1 DNA replication/repair protein RecF [Domibacillus mangrovi]
MHIEQLALEQYRNYESMLIEFDDTVNVIIGENAQGKTNVIESIYVLAMAKSHRTSNDKDLIRWEAEYAKIKGRVKKKHQSLPLELIISKKGKKAKVNHLEQTRLSQYIGNMNVVMFAPEDLTLVKGSPQVRRRFIDMEIGQVSPVYLHDLSLYHKVLQQRNYYLKQLQTKRASDYTMLDVLTEQLIELAVKVMKKRFEFICMLQKWAGPLHSGISRGIESLTILYEPAAGVLQEQSDEQMQSILEDLFQKGRIKEVDRGVTLTGPHRDDLLFYVNEKNIQTFGSQGQQRTTALAIKLAEIELIQSEIGEYPILLLDDVLSELDDYRQSHLLNTIHGKVQTFVTTTNTDGIEHATLNAASAYNVTDGAITQIK